MIAYVDVDVNINLARMLLCIPGSQLGFTLIVEKIRKYVSWSNMLRVARYLEKLQIATKVITKANVGSTVLNSQLER